MRWHDSCIYEQLYDTETDSTGAGDSPGPHLGPALQQLPDSASDTGHYYTKKMRRKHGLGLKVGMGEDYMRTSYYINTYLEAFF